MTPELFTHLNGDYRERACTPPPEARLRVPVTREDAIKFLEGACRNWSKVPRLSNDDLQDVATELSRFVASRALANEKEG